MCQLADVPMNAELIDSRRSEAESRVLGMNAGVQVRSAVRRICVWKCGNEMQEKLAD